MIDVIGAIALTALLVAIFGVLIGLAPARSRTKRILFVAAAGYATGVVVVAAAGGFAPGTTEPVPAVGLAVAASLLVCLAAWLWVPGFRDALLSLPLSALVGVHAGRVLGVFFLLLAASGRLSAPFAPVAGWGDVAVGVLAVPLAWRAARHERVPALGWWNALGALDLVVAVALGVLSAPGTPLQIFAGEPGTSAMGTLPWVMIPTLLVPLFFLAHATIAVKLASGRRHESVVDGHEAGAGRARPGADARVRTALRTPRR